MGGGRGHVRIRQFGYHSRTPSEFIAAAGFRARGGNTRGTGGFVRGCEVYSSNDQANLLKSKGFVFRKKNPPAIGVDIGTASVKVMEMTGSRGEYRVERFAVEPLP